jgi:hypothetical protein
MISMIDLECPYCGKTFSKSKSKYKYKKKNGQSLFYCSNDCRLAMIEQKIVNLECDVCSKKYTQSESVYKKTMRRSISKKHFCSSSCSSKFNNIRTEEQRAKISKNLKIYYSENEHVCKKERTIKICPVCGESFGVVPSSLGQIYCSRKCKDGDENKNTENMGGYRKGSGRGKSGWYKGYFCDSTYELAFLIYCLDHNIEIKRCYRKFSYGDGKYYHPDFIVDDVIVEIKGYMTDEVLEKAKSIPDEIKYEILTKKELKKHFNYISEQYHKKEGQISELYDNYKPEYNYLCDSCGKEFSTNKKRITETVYCSRTCSGKRKRK